MTVIKPKLCHGVPFRAIQDCETNVQYLTHCRCCHSYLTPYCRMSNVFENITRYYKSRPTACSLAQCVRHCTAVRGSQVRITKVPTRPVGRFGGSDVSVSICLDSESFGHYWILNYLIKNTIRYFSNPLALVVSERLQKGYF